MFSRPVCVRSLSLAVVVRGEGTMIDQVRDTESLHTIGILYPGEMGSCLGTLLVQEGWPVVTALEGRSPRTCRLGRDAGLKVLASQREVADRADIVFSVVPPAAAVSV